jgi:hypothetical protein
MRRLRCIKAAADGAFGPLLVQLNKRSGGLSIQSPGVDLSLIKGDLVDQSASSQLGVGVVISQARWRARVRPV